MFSLVQGVVADTHVCLVALNFVKANVAVLKLLTQRVGDLVIEMPFHKEVVGTQCGARIAGTF